eukprot:12889419-Prorocentrum_lima.AAC.1
MGAVAAEMAEATPFARNHDVPIIIVDAHAEVVVESPFKRYGPERGRRASLNGGRGLQGYPWGGPVMAGDVLNWATALPGKAGAVPFIFPGGAPMMVGD